jgi:hypothetical protein
MHRHVGVFAVGIMLSLVLATAADAANSIAINGASVPGGRGAKIDVSVTYSCDSTSGAKQLRVEVDDHSRTDAPDQSGAGASGEADASPTCDGAAHPVVVSVTSSHGDFRRGDYVGILVNLMDSSQHQVVRPERKQVVAG